MIHTGDCIEVMAAMEPDSVDSIVTDPPYGLEFMGKAWDAFKATGVFPGGGKKGPRGGEWAKANGVEAKGFDGYPEIPRFTAGTPFQAWCEAWGREALRVTRPGGYLLAFGGTRTHHRLVCGLEDAGWIIRDELDWIYASGFPKGKANLKPAHEPIVLARKPGPLQALAIDECRIGTTDDIPQFERSRDDRRDQYSGMGEPTECGRGGTRKVGSAGRWPSNVLLSDPALFDERNPEVVGSGAVTVDGVATMHRKGGTWFGSGDPKGTQPDVGYGDSGGYARFFIVPKADRADREPVVRGQMNGGSVWSDGREKAADYPSQRGKTSRENAHPTVKPVDLMRHLVRLVTPQGGTVLDPFLGSGSTAIAAELEGFAWLGIEKEPEYVAISNARLNHTQRGFGL